MKRELKTLLMGISKKDAKMASLLESLYKAADHSVKPEYSVSIEKNDEPIGNNSARPNLVNWFYSLVGRGYSRNAAITVIADSCGISKSELGSILHPKGTKHRKYKVDVIEK